MPQILELTALQAAGAGGSAPGLSVAPVVSGNTWVGQTLSCTSGTWIGDVSGGISYQWKDGSGNITAATGPTYVIASGENTRSIFCHVTATGTGGSTATDANTVGPVGLSLTPTVGHGKIQECANTIVPVFTAAPPANLIAPLVTGLTRVGSTLTCSTGTWTGSPTFAFQWDSNGNDIPGATANTYATVGDDIGANVSCSVTATTTGGATEIEASNAVLVVSSGSLPGPFSSSPALAGFATGATRLPSLSSSNPHLAVFD